MLRTPWDVKVPHRGLDHSVGLNFGPDGRLYAGGELGQVYLMETGKEQPKEVARTGGFVGGVSIDGDNNIYVCDSAKKAILRIGKDSKIDTYCSGFGIDKKPLILPNYSTFDEAANLYFSDSGPQSGYADYWKATGRVLRVDTTGKAESVLNNLYFPSGLALSQDGRELFVVQSSVSNVLVAPITQDGDLGPLRIFAQLPDTVPEGIAIGSDGSVYVSCYRPDAIYRIDTKRNLQLIIRDDTSELMNRVTNIAFPVDGSPEIYFANMGGWHIGSLGVETGGMKLNYPKI